MVRSVAQQRKLEPSLALHLKPSVPLQAVFWNYWWICKDKVTPSRKVAIQRNSFGDAEYMASVTGEVATIARDALSKTGSRVMQLLTSYNPTPIATQLPENPKRIENGNVLRMAQGSNRDKVACSEFASRHTHEQ